MNNRLKLSRALVLNIGKWLFLFGLLFLVLRSIQLDDLRERFQALSFTTVALFLALAWVARVIYALRWHLLVVRLGITAVHFSYTLRVTLLAEFVSLILPSYLGGDGIRLLKLKERSEATGRITLSIILDRILGLLALAALCALCSPILADLFQISVPVGVWWALLGLLGVGIFIFSRLPHPKLTRKLPPWLAQLQSVPLSKRMWWEGMVISGAGHLVYVTSYYLLFRQLAPVNYLPIVALSSSSLLMRSIPISVLGIDVSDGTLVALVSTVGITPDSALVVVSVIIASRYLFALLGLVIEFLLDGRRFLSAARTAPDGLNSAKAEL